MNTMRADPVGINWHPGLSIYASEQFLKAVGDEYGWLGGFDITGKLRCILPYTIIRKATVRMVRFRIETIPVGEPLEVEQEKTFLNSVADYFRSVGADIIIPGTTNAIFRTYPDGAIAAPYGTFIVDLGKSEECLWASVHSKHRNRIRNAIKGGVQVISGIEHVDTAYHLVRDTFKRSALPFMNQDAFMRMVNGLGSFIKIFVAEQHGIVQGCVVIPFSNYGAYYVYGGSIRTPFSGAINFLVWQTMLYFRGLGVKFYDFCGVRINPEEGSKQEGLMRFKQRFGPQLVQGYMWKCSLNRVKSPIYSLAVRLLRGGDIVDAERHKLTSAIIAESRRQQPASADS